MNGLMEMHWSIRYCLTLVIGFATGFFLWTVYIFYSTELTEYGLTAADEFISNYNEPVAKMSTYATSKEKQSFNIKKQSVFHKNKVSGSQVSLYIGLVTSRKYINTRGVAINRTWGQLATALEYYVGEGLTSNFLPIVSLPGTDDSYPPQKKVFHMYRYMYDHYIHQYDWFMRADDDLYVRIPELMKFLSKENPNKELYLGSPAHGRPEDKERLKLDNKELYCMGGTGVILSRALLTKLGPHLQDCLKSVVVSWNEDVEVGRCISHKLGIQCKRSSHKSNKVYNIF